MKSPRIWRKKRPGSGKLYGSYHTTVEGEDVNLRTSDANDATARAKDAHSRGRRNFVDEIDEAAAAVDGPAAAIAAPPAAAQRAPDPPVSSDFQATSSSATNPTPAPLQLQAAAAAASSSSSDDNSARAEAEATNAAAAADAGDDQGAPANDNAQPLPDIPPAVLDAMLTQAALVIVDVQLRLQGYAIGRALNKIPGEISQDSPARKFAADAWAAQLKIWIPADKMLPPWALALLLPAMCIPIQIATAQPFPDEKDGPDAAADESKAAA